MKKPSAPPCSANRPGRTRIRLPSTGIVSGSSPAAMCDASKPLRPARKASTTSSPSSGSSEQVAGRPHFHLRVQACGGPLAIGSSPCGPQLGEGASTNNGTQEQTIRAEDPPDQGQRAWQVVDLIEHAGADHQVEAGIGKGQAVLVTLNAAGGAGPGEAGVAAGDAGARRGLERAIETAEVEHLAEGAVHRRQAFSDAVQHGSPQEVMIGVARRRAIAAMAARSAIEDDGRRHGAACARRGCG